MSGTRAGRIRAATAGVTIQSRVGLKCLSSQLPGRACGVADVVKIAKGHTEGYEPNITDKIIELAVSAKGGKIANGAWTPPPPPPPARGPFG